MQRPNGTSKNIFQIGVVLSLQLSVAATHVYLDLVKEFPKTGKILIIDNISTELHFKRYEPS